MLKSDNIISLDIDGVLTDYPNCWLRFLGDKVGQNFDTVRDAKMVCGIKTYNEVKAIYRASDYKANLSIKNEAREFIDFFSDKGFEFVVATSRPILDPAYPSLMNLTKNWVHKNVQPNCNVYYKDETLNCVPILPSLKFHVDDELKYAMAFLKRNVPSFLIRNIQLPLVKLKGCEKPPVREVSSLCEIVNMHKRGKV